MTQSLNNVHMIFRSGMDYMKFLEDGELLSSRLTYLPPSGDSCPMVIVEQTSVEKGVQGDIKNNQPPILEASQQSEEAVHKSAVVDVTVADSTVTVTSITKVNVYVDVVVLVLSPTGGVQKNTTASHWKKLDLWAKYNIADAIDYGLTGVVIYRRATVRDKVQDGAVIGVTIESYQDILIKAVSSVNTLKDILEKNITRTLWTSLQNALVMKREAYSLNPSFAQLAGAIQVSENDMKRFTAECAKQQRAIKQGLADVISIGAAFVAPIVTPIYSAYQLDKLRRSVEPVMKAAETTTQRIGDVITSMEAKASTVMFNTDDRLQGLFTQSNDLVSTLSTVATTVLDSMKLGTKENERILGKIVEVGVLLTDMFDGTYFASSALFNRCVIKVAARLFNIFGYGGQMVAKFLEFCQGSFTSLYLWLAQKLGIATTSITGEETVLKEGITDLLDDARDILSALTTMIYTIVVGSLPTKKIMTDMMNGVKNFNAFSTFATNVGKWTTSFIEVVNGLVRTALGYICPEAAVYLRVIAGGDIRTWMHNTAALVDKMKVDNTAIYVNTEIQKEVNDLFLLGRGYAEEAIVNIALQKTVVGVALSTRLKELQGYYDTLMAMKGHVTTRQPPFVIWIAGRPGIGKSTVVRTLVNMLIGDSVPESRRMYARNPNSECWDGYQNQPVVVIDDACQFADGVDMRDLMQMVTPTPFPLKFASLDNPSIGIKGGHFTSKIVIVTSNTMYPKTTGLMDLKALWRRRNVLVDMRMTRDDGLSDEARTIPGPEEFSADMSHCYFVRRNPNNYSATDDFGHNSSFREFLEDITDDYLNFEARQTRQDMTVNYSDLTARVNERTVVKQGSGEFSPWNVRRAINKDARREGTFYYQSATGGTYKARRRKVDMMGNPMDSFEEYDVEVDPVWIPCCAVTGCMIPTQFTPHRHVVTDYMRQDQEGHVLEQRKNMDLVRLEPGSTLDPSWELYYEKVGHRESGSKITDDAVFYRRTELDPALGWSAYLDVAMRKTMATVTWFQDHWIGIYLAAIMAPAVFGCLVLLKNMIFGTTKPINVKKQADADTRRVMSDVKQSFSDEMQKKEGQKRRRFHIRPERKEGDILIDEQTGFTIQRQTDLEKLTKDEGFALILQETQRRETQIGMEKKRLADELMRQALQIFVSVANKLETTDRPCPRITEVQLRHCIKFLQDAEQLRYDDLNWADIASYCIDRNNVIMWISEQCVDDDFFGPEFKAWASVGVGLIPEHPENRVYFSAFKRTLVGVIPQPTRRESKIVNETMKDGELSKDMNAENLLEFLLPKAMVHVRLVTDKKRMALNGVCIEGQYILVPYHFFCDASGKEWTIGHNQSCKCTEHCDRTINIRAPFTTADFDVQFNPKNLIRLTGQNGLVDLAIYYCGPRMMAMRKTLDHWMTNADVTMAARFRASMMTIRPQGDNPVALVRFEINAEPVARTICYDLGEDGQTEHLIMTGWTHNGQTINGDCGGVLVCHSSRMIHKIVGVHVASSASMGEGYAEVVTQEMIISGMRSLQERLKVTGAVKDGLTVLGGLEPLTDTQTIPEGNFTMVGRAPASMVPRMAEKTSLRESVIYDKVYPPLCEPVILSNKDPRVIEYGLAGKFSPLMKGVAKFGQKTLEFYPPTLQRVKDYMREAVFGKIESQHRRIATEFEVINGNPTIGWEGMDMDTSPGFPWVKDRPAGFAGKRWLFEFDIDQTNGIVKNEKLRSDLDIMDLMMRQGKTIPTVWTHTLKDEKREIWKVKIGKTRVFTASPVTSTMLGRKYTIAFNSAFINAKLMIPSAVGMDPFSGDWDYMIRRLVKNSDLAIAGDFGNWDGHMHPEVVDMVCDLINEWYGDCYEHQCARKVIFHEMIHTLGIANNVIFFKHYGEPSGCAMTSIINTLGNIAYFAMAWLELVPEQYQDLAFYQQMVEIFFFGDDHLGTVASAVGQFFNMFTLEKWFAKLGHEYTPPEKNMTIDTAFHPVKTQMFLKNTTTEIDGKFWPLMSMNTIRETVNWIRKCDDPYLATHENCANALRFTFFYGKEVFEEMRTALSLALLRYAKHHGKRDAMILPSFEYYNIFYGKQMSLPFLIYGLNEAPTVVQKSYGGKSKKMDTVKQGDNGHLSTGLDPNEPRAMLSEPNSENKLGIVQVNQVPPEKVIEQGAFTKSKLAEGHMSDNRWTLAHMVERPTLVNTFTWNATSAMGDLVWNAYLPGELLVPSAVNHVPFQWFHRWRGQIVLRFQVNGSQWHCGRLLIAWIPLMGKNRAAQYYANNMSALTAIHHAELDPSTSNIVDFVVDFCHPEDYIAPDVLVAERQLGTLALYVLSPLRVGATGAQFVNISVTVQFLKNEFKILKGVDSPAMRNEDSIYYMPKEMVDYMQERRRKQMGGKVVKQGNSFSNVYNQNFKDSATVTMGQSNEADLIGSGATANVSGLDKPNFTLEPLPVANSTFGYLSHGTNVQYAERLAMDPGVVPLVKPEHIGTHEDEMDLHLLRQRYSLDRVVTWSTAQTSNTILSKGFMCPFSKALEGVIMGNIKPATGVWPKTYYSLTCLDYLSIPFSFWKGGIKVKIVLVASSFHVGKLFFGLDYGDTDVPMTLQAATSEYGIYMDMNEGQHEFEFEMKFQSDTSGKRVPNGTKGGYGNDENMKFATGVWSLRVINELVSPHETADTIDVLVYFAAADDFECFGLDINNASVKTFAPNEFKQDAASFIRAEKQGEVVAPSDKQATTDNYGEDYRSLQKILKRYFLAGHDYGDNFLKAGTAGRDFYFNLPYSIIDRPDLRYYSFFQCTGVSNGVFGYFSASYGACRGSMRMKMAFSSPIVPVNILATYLPWGFIVRNKPSGTSTDRNPWDIEPLAGTFRDTMGWIGNITAGTASPMSFANNSPNGTINIEIPYNTRYNFSRTQPYSDFLSIPSTQPLPTVDDQYTMGTVKVDMQWPTVPSGTDRPGQMNIFMAAGDEFRLAVWYGPPKIYILSGLINTDQYDQWPDTYQLV